MWYFTVPSPPPTAYGDVFTVPSLSKVHDSGLKGKESVSEALRRRVYAGNYQWNWKLFLSWIKLCQKSLQCKEWNFHHYESSAKIRSFYIKVTDDSNNNIWFKGAKWYEADDGTFLRILIWIILSIQQRRQRSVGWSLIINHWMWKYVITATRPGLHFANVWLHTVLMYNLLITYIFIDTN